MHAPRVHDHRFELRGHTRFEDAVVHRGRHAHAVIHDDEGARVGFAAGGDEDPLGVSVSGVAQQLDDDVFNGTDVVLRLSSLGLGDIEAYETVAEVLLDLDEGVAGDGGDEVHEVVVGSHEPSITSG